MTERRPQNHGVDRKIIIARNSNGFHVERIPYSPILPHEEKNNLLEVVLERSGKKLLEVPLEVVKTVAVVDTLDLDIADKIRVAGYIFWEVDGKWDLVKTWLGESEGPKQESLINNFLERDELISMRSKANKERRLLDAIVSTSKVGKNPNSIPIFVSEISERRESGVEDLLRAKRSIVLKVGKEIKKTQEYILETSQQELCAGVNYHDIYRKHGVERDILRKLRRKLFEEGKLDIVLESDELKVKQLRDKKIKNNDISQLLNLPHNVVDRIAGKLLLMGLIDPFGRNKSLAEKTRHLYDIIIDLHKDGFSTQEMAKSLGQSYFKIRHAKYRLREAGEITGPPINKVAERRRQEAQERRAKIKAALQDPQAMVEHLPRIIPGLTVAQAKRHANTMIREGEILPRRIVRKKFLKETLRERMRAHLKSKAEEDFAFWKYIKEVKTDFGTALSLYEEIEREETVPPIRRRTRAGLKSS